MKKSILFASAALAALTFTSCSNEVDMFQTIGSEKATIDLNVSNDVLMATRASTGIDAEDYAKWLVNVSPNANATNPGTTTETGWISASPSTTGTCIGNRTFNTGDYTIEVRNYSDADAAYKANDDRGDAYYVGSVNKTLTKGSNTVTIDCKQAQNCRITVNLSDLVAVNTIINPSVTVTQDSRVKACPALEDGDTGYFIPGEPLSYVLNYWYKAPGETTATEKHSTSVSIESPAIHTEYSIVATTTDTGKIVLTIECDGYFNPVNQPTITIDAATGKE